MNNSSTIKKYFLLSSIFLFVTLVLNLASYFAVSRINKGYASARNATEGLSTKVININLVFQEINTGTSGKDLNSVWQIFDSAEKELTIISTFDPSSEIRKKMEALKGSIIDIISAKDNPAVNIGKLQENYQNNYQDLCNAIRDFSNSTNRYAEKYISGAKLAYAVIIFIIAGSFVASFFIASRFAMEMQSKQDVLQSEMGKLESVLDTIDNALLVIDIHSTIKKTNKGAAKLFSCANEELVGVNLIEIVPSFKKLVPEFAKVAQFRKEQVFEREKANIGNIERTLKIKLSPIKETDDMLVMIEDITYGDYIKSDAVHEEKISAFKRLLTILVHNFSEILSDMINAINIMEVSLDKSGRSDEVMKHNIKVIESLTEKAYLTVQRLHTFSQERTCRLQPVDITLLVKNLLEKCNSIFDDSVEICATIPDEHIFMRADPALLEQSLFNICENAAHALTIMKKPGEEWGGTIEVVIDKIYPDRNYRQIHPLAVDSAYWLIYISDNGVGIDTLKQSAIFDPFFSTKKNAAGIGLSIAYEIIRNHGGFIEVYSQPGKGSRFTVFLPDNI